VSSGECKLYFDTIHYIEHFFTILNDFAHSAKKNYSFPKMLEEKSSSSVARALTMLELVAESSNGLTNSDLSRRLKIPRSSASYILRVLEKREYLRRDAGGRYWLGLKLMSLTGGAVFHMDVREVAKPILADFLKKSRLPEVHLAVLDNGRAVYIEKLENETSFIKMDIWVGHRLPVHTTAIGKVLVSYLPEVEILAILEERGMERKTKRSITSPAKFLREAAQVRQYGFAVDNEENSDSVRCIAAPIFDAKGKVLAALGTSAVVLHISEEQLPKIVQLVKVAAAKVSARIGFTG
jgi:DNA-binding IclR family transcriptional regulator